MTKLALSDLEALERFYRDVRDGRVEIVKMENIVPHGKWIIDYKWNRDIEAAATHDIYVGDVSKGLVKL